MLPRTADLEQLPGVTPLEPFGVGITAQPEAKNLTDWPIPKLRELVRRHRLLVLRGFDTFPEAQALSDWCHAWGKVMAWPFGDVLELQEADTPTDHIFDSSCVPFHWDGMYKPLIPEFQVFQCVQPPGSGDGGRTTFCDTVKLLAETDPALSDLWRKVTVTYRIRSVVHYGGQAVSPLIVPHPRTGEATLRFNEPPPDDEHEFLNRPLHAFDGVEPDDVPDLLAGLHDALHDARYYYAHTWQAGDLVIADNYSLLHGRERFTSRAPRHLRRVHLLGDPEFANPAVAA